MENNIALPDCTKLFIGGYWKDPAVAASYTNENPALRKALCEVAIAGEADVDQAVQAAHSGLCLLYTSPSPRDRQKSRMPSSA